jgi:hypothetical protein
MTAPGLRPSARQSEKMGRFKLRLTTCPHCAPLYPVGAWASFRSLIVRSTSARFWPAYAGQNLAGRDRYAKFRLANGQLREYCQRRFQFAGFSRRELAGFPSQSVEANGPDA